MQKTSTSRSTWRSNGAGLLAVAGSLVMNSAFALTGGPFAFVPAGNSGSHFFSVVDLNTKAVVASHCDVNIANINTDPDTGFPVQNVFFAASVNPKTNMLFISDFGHSESVWQIDISKIAVVPNTTQCVANTAIKFYTVDANLRGLSVDPSGKHVFAGFPGGIGVIDTTAPFNPAQPRQGVTFIDMGINNPVAYDVRLNVGGTVGYVTDSSSHPRLCRFNAVTPPDAITDNDCVPVSINGGLPNPTQIGVSPDGTRVYVINHNENSVSVVDTTKSPMQVLRSFKLRFQGNVISAPNGIAISQSGKRGYISTQFGHVLTLDLAQTENGQDPDAPEAVIHDLANANLGNLNGTALSPDGTHLIVADSTPSSVHFININATGVADSQDANANVTVDGAPTSYDQFTTPDDRIFVSEIGVSAVGG